MSEKILLSSMIGDGRDETLEKPAYIAIEHLRRVMFTMFFGEFLRKLSETRDVNESDGSIELLEDRVACHRHSQGAEAIDDGDRQVARM